MKKDEKKEKGLERGGYRGNTFVVGVESNKVTYYNGNKVIMTIKYEQWKKAEGK